MYIKKTILYKGKEHTYTIFDHSAVDPRCREYLLWCMTRRTVLDTFIKDIDGMPPEESEKSLQHKISKCVEKHISDTMGEDMRIAYQWGRRNERFNILEEGQSFSSLLGQVDNYKNIAIETIQSLPILNDDLQKLRQELTTIDTFLLRVETIEVMFYSQFIKPTLILLSIPQYPDIEIGGRIIQGGVSHAEYILVSLTPIPERLGVFLGERDNGKEARKKGFKYIFGWIESEEDIDMLEQELRHKPAHRFFASNNINFDSSIEEPVRFLHPKIKVNITLLAELYVATVLKYLDELRTS